MNTMRFQQIGLVTLLALPLTTEAQEMQPKKTQFAAAVNLLQVTEDNVGFGASYEVFLNKQGNVSLYLPFSYALPVNKYNHPDTREGYYYNGYGSYNNFIELQNHWTRAKGMAYFYPGVKFYTGKKLARVSYCIGASLLVGVGSTELNTVNFAIDTLDKGPDEYYYRRMVSSDTEDVSRLKLGMLVTNALNFRIGQHIYTGLEFGIGYTYLNKEGGVNIQREMLAQMGVKLGYYR